MFGCQVMNQSVENGSMPRAGDSPWTSLYRRSRRSYDRSVSDSSTCRRAPSLISAIARWICWLSETMLLIRMVDPRSLRSSDRDVGQLAGHHDVRVQSGDGGTGGARLGLRMAGQQVPDHVVVEAETQDQLVRTGDLHQLRRRQLIDDAGDFFGHAQPVEGLGLVGADHVLGQHEVRKVGLADFLQKLFVAGGDGAHGVPPGSVPLGGGVWLCCEVTPLCEPTSGH